MPNTIWEKSGVSIESLFSQEYTPSQDHFFFKIWADVRIFGDWICVFCSKGNLYDEQPELLKWINSDGQLDLELTKQLGYEPYFTNTTK